MEAKRSREMAEANTEEARKSAMVGAEVVAEKVVCIWSCLENVFFWVCKELMKAKRRGSGDNEGGVQFGSARKSWIFWVLCKPELPEANWCRSGGSARGVQVGHGRFGHVRKSCIYCVSKAELMEAKRSGKKTEADKKESAMRG
eukprot:1159182-Pelagomonas_calceolata.AAC.4